MKPKTQIKPAKTITITHPNFRVGSTTTVKEVIFSFMAEPAKTAALGDMICWMPAIKFVAETYNYVQGHLIVPEYFMEVAQNLMREYPHWRVHTKIPERLANAGTHIRVPAHRTVNATMGHLIPLGFIYFALRMDVPEGWMNYVELDLEDVPLHPEVEGKKYAVMTPGATAVNRAMPAETYNFICDHLISKGITPVHLGVTNMEGRTKQPEFDKRYDFSKGINLLNKTSVLEAAKIISLSEMTIGIDNGLLHLAGTTDADIIFGFTMAGPNQRRIYRKHGHTLELYPSTEELRCFSCQEHIRFFLDHNFVNCMYKEEVPQCVKILTKESWTAGIDAMLAEREEAKDEETFNF